MITNLRLRYLVVVQEIGFKNSTGYASPTEVSDTMKRAAKPVRKMMLELKEIGWLENPYRGCYRLTDEGQKTLEKARAPTKKRTDEK